MSGSRMVQAVNALVARLLAGAGEVFLPGVGSLVTERRAARRLSKRQIVPPHRAVVFTSQQRGGSLADAIADAAGVDAAKAAEIYGTWLARVRDAEDALVIEGVGVLKTKHFTVDEAFDRQLNPGGRQAVQLRRPRRFDWSLWIGGAAILFAVAFGVWQYVVYEGKSVVTAARSLEKDPAPLAQPTAGALPGAGPAAADSTIREVHATAAAGIPEEQETAVSPESERIASVTRNASPEEGVAPLVSGRRYVVLGVFSTPENARRAAAAAAELNPVLRCGVYRFGAKYMVSPFESEEQEACTQFIRAHAATHPGMWTYKAR